MRKKLLAVIAVLLLAVAVLTAVVFYDSERRAYKQNLIESNQVMANQIASVYELCVQSTKEIAHKTTYSDADIMALTSEARSLTQKQKEISSLLGSLSVMNPYVHSAYLYYTEDNIVYSSYSIPYSVTTLDNFGDKDAFNREETTRPYLGVPHLLRSSSMPSSEINQPLVIGYVTPVKTGATDHYTYLCINLNMRSLYALLFREFNLDENLGFYIVNDEGYIVFHKDPGLLFTKQEDLPEKSDVIVSTAYSGSMNLKFVFENVIPPLQSDVLKFSATIMLALLLVFIVAVIAVMYSTLPIRKMVQLAKDTRLRNFLAGQEREEKEAGMLEDSVFLDKPMQESKNFSLALFSFASAQDVDVFLNQIIKNYVKEQVDILFLAVKMSKDSVAIILGNTLGYNAVKFDEQVQFQCLDMVRTFNNNTDGEVCCVISTVKGSVEELPSAYGECCRVLEYSYSFSKQIMWYEEIDETLPRYAFPARNGKHIINNLLAGKKEACYRYIDEVFDAFRSGDYCIEDKEIDGYLLMLQENIALQLQALPVVVEPPERYDFVECNTLDELYIAFSTYIENVLGQLEQKLDATGNNMQAAVLEYIENHFCENDICLNKISHDLNLPSNAVSKVVKEASGRSFSEYVTYKRVQHSKELLGEGKLNINEISEEVGFTYPYYFIRKFKELEGITPGQYSSGA